MMNSTVYQTPQNNQNVTTPFHYEVYNGHLDLCKFLMENLEDKSPKNEHGMTPLHFAAERGFLDICKYILENSDEKSPLDDNGETPFHFAVENRHFDVCDYIIRNVYDPRYHDRDTTMDHLQLHPWIN